MITLADAAPVGGTLTTILTSAVIAAVAAAVVTGLFTRRKLSAEATKIITDAASGVVTELRTERIEDRKEIDRLKTENREQAAELRGLKTENRGQAAELRAMGHVLEVHSAWDRQAFEVLQAQGIKLPPPPPLYRSPDAQGV